MAMTTRRGNPDSACCLFVEEWYCGGSESGVEVEDELLVPSLDRRARVSTTAPESLVVHPIKLSPLHILYRRFGDQPHFVTSLFDRMKRQCVGQSGCGMNPMYHSYQLFNTVDPVEA